MPSPLPSQPSASLVYEKRYAWIDGLRGLAALAVVVGHVAQIEPLGAAAVMVFFVISGYCISAALASALGAGIGFRAFMLRRVRRIYPPYILAVLFFVATRILRDRFASPDTFTSFDPTSIDWLLNATLTQWMNLVPHPTGWPHENPVLFVSVFWSLCYEEQFYIVMGVLAMTGRMHFALPLSAISLLWILYFPTTCHGWFVEYWPMFAVGCLVYWRLCVVSRLSARVAIDVGLVVVASLAFTYATRLPWARDLGTQWWGWNGSDASRNAFGDLGIAAMFGFLLIAMRASDSWYRSARIVSVPMGWLGTISYSLYLVHNFNLRLSAEAARLILKPLGMTSPGVALYFVQILILIIIAMVFHYFAERPFLKRPLATVHRPD